MTQPAPVASLLEVDDTMLHSDWIGADLKRHLTRAFATEGEGRYCFRPIGQEAAELHQDLP